MQKARVFEDHPAIRVSHDDLRAGRARGFHQVRVHLNDAVRNASRTEDPRKILAIHTIADDDYVVRGGGFFFALFLGFRAGVGRAYRQRASR